MIHGVAKRCIVLQSVRMEPDYDSIGHKLLQFSEKPDRSTQGVVERLFPFIYQASQRMSLRAIAAWLSKTQNVHISYSTISRALRHSKRRLQDFGDELEVYARMLAEEWSMSWEEILEDEMRFRFNSDDLRRQGPSAGNEIVAFSRFSRAISAIEALENRWFVLDEDIRAQVLELIRGNGRLDEEEEAHDAFCEQDETEREEL